VRLRAQINAQARCRKACTDTDIEETLGALTDLVHQGKVRYLSSSTFPASQIVEAQWVARDRHLERFVTEQPPYSILVRAVEADVLPTCARHGMGVMSYSPLAGGWLSGRWRKDAGQQSSSRSSRLPERFDLSLPANQRKLDAVEQLAQLAERRESPSSSSQSPSSSTTAPSPRRSADRGPWSS
jgi:aryl-alcohol dehydrogenase-like predicted oxidoreductase